MLAVLRGEGYAVGDAPQVTRRDDGSAAGRSDQRDRGTGVTPGGVAWPLANYESAFAASAEKCAACRSVPLGEDRSKILTSSPAIFALGCIASATSSSGCSRRAVTTSTPRAPITIPIWYRPHHYLAFYLWLRREFGLHAIVHLGKHGNLEWLPGKSTGLSADCLPDAVLGPVPHLYPFIVNDPGEGIQAKRRASAVIIDHLTPPMTRAELHDDLARLETLVDEYALAADLDPKRATVLAEDILSLARAQRLDADVNVTRDTPTNEALRALDAHLCDLKEMQIRDGLHVFGRVPADIQRNDLIVSIARLPRSDLKVQDASLHQALARDLGLGAFDPLTRDLAADFAGPRPGVLAECQHCGMAHIG